MLYHKLLEQKKYLLTEIQNIKHRLASYPEGELICAKNGKYVTCMHSLNGIYTYIPKKKSEALIDQSLFMHKIPFRYECALHLKGITLYPDFTIRHPESGEYFYWEHFGLMDSPTYSQNTFQKLNTYCQNNIIPTINLITTYETKEHPLTSKIIENTIREYFVF